MDWLELSEINFGLVWEGRRLPSAFPSDNFAPPYDEAMEILQKPGASKEDVVKAIAPKVLQRAHDAVKNMNGLGDESAYDDGLATAASNYRLGKQLEKAGSKLQRNESVDILPISGELSSRIANQGFGAIQASKIDFSHYKPFQKSGWKVYDDVLGNFPADGPIILFGPQGVGKSHFASHLVDMFLHEHKDKTVGMYTLEMAVEHWMHREVKMYPTIKEVLDRLFVSGSVRGVEDLVAEISAKRYDFAVIDGIDDLVSDESASAYQSVYRRFKEICRFIKIPVMILAQPNRAAKLAGRFLTEYDISWSSGAENSAALLLALQKTSSFDIEDDDKYPTKPDEKYYLQCLKSRDGYPLQMGPGALIIEPSTQLFRGKLYESKSQIWSPNGTKRSIGKKKRKNDDD